MATKQQDIYFSPLRYPGGKGLLSQFFKDLLYSNDITNGTYCEVYAGGAAAAIDLILSGDVDRIILNDADFHIYAFWYSILHETDSFIESIRNSEISISEWMVQREIYENFEKYSLNEIGFSTFFLNRTNRSGILPKTGPIGGKRQEGNYKINARFNKDRLIQRILRIAERSEQIEIYNLDAKNLLQNVIRRLDPNTTLIYLDPPYFKQGRYLYLNYYTDSDHERIANELRTFFNYFWIISYDNVLEISNIYYDYRQYKFDLQYSLQNNHLGKELIIFSDNLRLPDHFRLKNQSYRLICS